MEGQTPSVGRIVHYVSGEGVVHRAAIITAVDPQVDGRVSLTVFNPPAIEPAIQHVDEEDLDADGGLGWHWPERV